MVYTPPEQSAPSQPVQPLPTDHTASQHIIADNKNKMTVIDAKGRVIQLKEPDELDNYDLMRVLGQDSQIPGCVGMAMPLIYLESIEGVPVNFPQTYAELRFLIKRLGKEGRQAVLECLQQNGLLTTEDKQGEVKNTLKK